MPTELSTVSPVEVEFTIDGPSDGYPVLLLGPLGLDWKLWNEQVSALSPKFRTIRYNHRGLGGTPSTGLIDGSLSVADLAADALALLDMLGIQKAHFVGISLGALTAMWIAATHPERVDRIVTMSAVPRANQDTPTMLQIISNALHAYENYYEFGTPLGWNEHAEIAREDGMEVATAAMMKMLFTAEIEANYPAETQDVRAQLLAFDPALYAALCETIGRVDITPKLRRITAPLAILACEDDWSTPPGTSRQITLAVNDSIRIIIPKAGHLGTYPDPWLVAGKVLGHLSGTLTDKANIS
ncbi:MAG: 3-oxoadipate enol-lactonase [Subtercola sp.]|nr:3-oxoadipate enol-lactonase [Subtercola sp.]